MGVGVGGWWVGGWHVADLWRSKKKSHFTRISMGGWQHVVDLYKEEILQEAYFFLHM